MSNGWIYSSSGFSIPAVPARGIKYWSGSHLPDLPRGATATIHDNYVESCDHCVTYVDVRRSDGQTIRVDLFPPGTVAQVVAQVILVTR